MRGYMLIMVLAALAPVVAQVSARQTVVSNRYFADQRTITVDGDLKEWNFLDRPVEITVETGKLDPGPVRSRADSSAMVKAAWDAKYLYLAAKVKDQSLVALPNEKAMPWNCDSLIFVTSVFGATKGNDRYQQKKTVETSTEPFYGFSYYTEKTGPRKWTPHSRYIAKSVADGYVLEAAIAFEDIGFGPQAGDLVKMAFILADHDADKKFSQISVGFPKKATANSTNSWYDLRFRGAAPFAGEMITSRAKNTADQGVEFLADIDAFTPNLQVKNVAVKDAAGKIVASLPADCALQPGKTTLLTGKLADAKLAPGAYRIAAVVEGPGVKAPAPAAQAMFEIVLSDEPVQGAVGKLPNRYIVPDPYRFYAPSTAWGYKQQTITKDDYLKMVKKVYDFEYASIFSKGEAANAGVHGFGYCMTPYALYKATGDVQYLKPTLGLVKGAIEAAKTSDATPFWINQYKVVTMLSADPNVSAADKKILNDYYPFLVKKLWATERPKEWGAFNRALIWGGMLDIAATTMPNDPAAKDWKAYADLEWNSWWPYRDHDENSSDYNGSSMMDYMDWAEFRNPDNLKDPGMKKWVERYMYQVTPSGGMPGYGDASPWNASFAFWIPVYERMATITRDGRFKWAAHRLLEYANRQMEDWFSYHMVYDSAAVNCAWAYIYADDTVAEAQPEMKSRITERKQVLWVDDALRKELFDKFGINGLYYKLGEATQPDKLLLRAGGDPFAPCGMIELCSNAGHHMSTVPNLNNFMHMRSVLLTDLGYFEKGPEYHNVVYVEDLTGIAPEVPDEVVTVPAFAAGRRQTYAAINVQNYKNWPVTNDRRVLFTDLGLTLVKDLIDFKQPFVCRLRQQWQVHSITPKSGDNWVNTSMPYVIMSGLGLGRGVQRWINPNWDLMIYFTPQAGRDYEVFDRSLENIWQAVPLRVSQRWRGLPEGGKPVHFTTLLWPHKPILDVDDFARRITVLKDTPETTVFKVVYDDNRTVYLGINDGAPIELEGIATDARVFYLEGAVKDGKLKATYLYAVGATKFVNGITLLHQTAEKTDVDKNL